MSRILWRTFEDITHLTECFIFSTGENLNSCLEIANLRGDKGIGQFCDRILEKRRALHAAVYANGIRVGRFCSGHDVQPANWGVSDSARKPSDSSSLGVFLSPRLTGWGIVVVMFLG